MSTYDEYRREYLATYGEAYRGTDRQIQACIDSVDEADDPDEVLDLILEEMSWDDDTNQLAELLAKCAA